MIQELDLVVLMRSIKEKGLQLEDVGTVVHCYEDSQAYEVEFIDGDGETFCSIQIATWDDKTKHLARYKSCLFKLREILPWTKNLTSSPTF
jgi:hypothetical protein